MTISNSTSTRRLFLSSSAISAALIVVALVARHYFSFVNPLALCAGCAFALLNLAFYKYLSTAILDASSPRRGLMAIVALLKLPVLALLIFILTRQSMTVIANVLAGSLVFIPGALLAGLGRPEEGEKAPDSSFPE